MSNDVFANGREISCKKADGKTICEFPDVCFTPPENPATPPGVPVPYPNTAFAKDTTEGSKNVKISGQEVMLKNKSYFKTSTGDEAGAAAKKGVITSTNKGKAYFIGWSMDVKFEGENVIRHLDQTTNNHASPMANGSAPMVYMDTVTIADMPEECREAQNQQRDAERALPPAKKRQGHVTAGAVFKPGGQTFKASSNVRASAIAKSSRFKGFSPGVAPRHAPKPGVSSVKCGGNTHEYRNSGSSPTGDAEAKIIEGLFSSFNGNPPRGTLYLKVVGAPVCCDCQTLIKCASKSINIVVCPPARKDPCPKS